MDKILWCVKKGLCLVSPNSDLATAYLKKANESLESMSVLTSKDWKVSTAYYTIYFSLYAVLMRIGVKCEIHSCTIEFAEQFLDDYFSEDDLKFIESSLAARIDSQYYVDRVVPDELADRMFSRAPEFMIKCKAVIIDLNESKINKIREEFKR